jgi:hypothetical protein
MSPEDLINNLDGAFEKVLEEMKPVMEEAALTGKALLAKQVQNKGFGSQYVPGRYIKLRASKGYEIRFVNVTFTGKMFQGWRIPNTLIEGKKVIGTVGGSDESVRNKIKWNHSRYPNFINLSPEDRGIIKDNLIVPRATEIINRIIFGR